MERRNIISEVTPTGVSLEEIIQRVTERLSDEGTCMVVMDFSQPGSAEHEFVAFLHPEMATELKLPPVSATTIISILDKLWGNTTGVGMKVQDPVPDTPLIYWTISAFPPYQSTFSYDEFQRRLQNIITW